MPGPKPLGERAMTPAERQARRRAALAAGAPKPAVKAVKVVYRRPADRRSKPARWADAVKALADMLDDYERWRDNLPPSLADSVTAERIDAVLELRELVDQLAAVDLPSGFGRDR
jgi:hypothetical protein